jgi:EmrB/QacA subfamily drug resistance transporter
MRDQSVCHRLILASAVPFVCITDLDPIRREKGSRPVCRRLGVSAAATNSLLFDTERTDQMSSLPIKARARWSSPTAPRPTWTLVLAGLGVFMTCLDNLVVATALPVLRVDLHASLQSLEWTVNAYVLSFACLLLTGAALGDRFGRRRMFAIGVSIFTAASAAAALSPSAGALIAARVAQGAGAAIVFPLTLTLISEAFTAEKRGAAIGIWGGIAGVAVAGGPVLGGAILTAIDWHWIFWLNVPIGIAVVPLALMRLSESFGPRPKFDIAGVSLAAGAALGLTWGLVRSSAAGWGSLEVIAAMLAGIALAVAFIAWERHAPSPIIHLGLFREPAFASANAVSFLMNASTFGSMFIMTQFLQLALGHSPLDAGVWLLPWTGAPMVIMPIAGKLADRYGNRSFMVAGLALQAIGLGWVAAIAAPRMGYAQLGIALAIAGLGISLVFPAVANAVLGSVPPEEAGVASGTNSTMRELGGVFGVAVLAAVFARDGAYSSPPTFVHGVTTALWVGAGLSALGITAAAFTPGRKRRTQDAAPHGLALSGDPAWAASSNRQPRR